MAIEILAGRWRSAIEILAPPPVGGEQPPTMRGSFQPAARGLPRLRTTPFFRVPPEMNAAESREKWRLTHT